MVKRCSWVSQDPLYQDYHDNEWGIPEYSNHKLFENICLEGQQAGLSWITVLKKREDYRKCFYNFDPHKIALMTEDDLDQLVQNPALIRHRAKLKAIVTNAKAYLAMQEQGINFSEFIWSFVDGKPLVNRFTDISQVPAKIPQSDALAKALKKHGFVFFGSTTCYAFMQSMGLVNDHFVDCDWYETR